MQRFTTGILIFWSVFIVGFAGLNPEPSASTPTRFPANPLPAHTGGFGEKSCHSCHSEAEVNPPGGTLEVSWAHESIRPGREHTLKMVLAHPGMRRAGFQMTARYASGPDAGKQAGRFVPSPDDHVVTEQDGISYVSHTLEGGKLTKPAEVEWTVVWVAPAGRRDVVFHVSAVAGDEDESQYGDLVYVKEFRPRVAN